MAISCSCEVIPRVYSYGNSAPEVPVGDLRKRIEDEEYLNDQTIGQMDLPICESIGKKAFEASSITGIYAPSCVIVDERAFYNCDNISNGVDFSSVKEIKSYAFAYCDVKGEHADWAFDSVEKIGDYAFAQVHNSTTLTTPNLSFSSVQEIGINAFRETDFWYTGYNTTIILPKCKKIDDFAFYAQGNGQHNVYLTELNLPAIEEIGTMAFRCIEPPSGQTLNIYLGPNCTHLEANIFYWWAGRERINIYCYATTPPTLDGYFSSSVGSLEGYPRHIYVPTQSLEAYKSAPYWSGYNVASVETGTDIYQPIPT